MVAMHREHFGRGPGAARTLIDEGLVVCVLSDVYTAVEKTLLQAGHDEQVRQARILHQRALAGEYEARVERIVGRPVTAFLNVTHADPDLSVATFLLGGGEEG